MNTVLTERSLIVIKIGRIGERPSITT